MVSSAIIYRVFMIFKTKDGMPFYSENSKKIILKLDRRGKYRFEAYFKNNPWIFSNPIKVK